MIMGERVFLPETNINLNPKMDGWKTNFLSFWESLLPGATFFLHALFGARCPMMTPVVHVDKVPVTTSELPAI